MILLSSFTLVCLAAIGFVYFGYPVILTLLALRRRRPVRRGDHLPAISLITAAHNEEPVIAKKLENVLALRYPRDLLQIVLVSDGSTDRTARIAGAYEDQGVQVLELRERGGKSQAINAGLARATGKVIVINDANAFCLPDALLKLAQQFNDAEVGCVTGRKAVRAGQSAVGRSEGVYWRYESYIRRKESEIGSTTGLVGGILAVRRELFDPIPPHVINDDVYVGMQVLKRGYRVVYDPETVFWQMSTVDMRAESVRRRRISAGRFQLLFNPALWPSNDVFVLFQLFAHKFLRLLLPFLMIGALLGNVALALWFDSPPFFRVTLAGQAAFYLLALLGWAAERTGRPLKAAGVAYFIASGNLTAIEGLAHYLSGRQTVLWQKAERGQVT